MSVCSVNFGNLMDSSSSGHSPSSGYERECRVRRRLRVRTEFEFPLIALENPVVITNFEGDASHQEMRKSLSKYLECAFYHRVIERLYGGLRSVPDLALMVSTIFSGTTPCGWWKIWSLLTLRLIIVGSMTMF